MFKSRQNKEVNYIHLHYDSYFFLLQNCQFGISKIKITPWIWSSKYIDVIDDHRSWYLKSKDWKKKFIKVAALTISHVWMRTKKEKKKGKLIWLIVWMSHEVEKINQKKKQKKQRFDFSEEKWPLEWEFIDLICF